MAHVRHFPPGTVRARGPLALAVLMALGAACAAEPSVPSCRRFATQIREVRTEVTPDGVSKSAESITTCAFDSDQIALTCTTPGPGGTVDTNASQVTRWASLADAVADNVPIGRSTAQSVSSTQRFCPFTREYRYDVDGRLTAIQSSVEALMCGDFSFEYDRWDSRQRPLSGMVTGVGVWAACVGQRITVSINDASRSQTLSYRGGSDCIDRTVTRKYDADGILLSSLTTYYNSWQRTFMYTALATSTICR